MTFQQFVKAEAEKYNDGRENDPDYICMMKKLFKIRQRAKASVVNKPAEPSQMYQTNLGYGFSK